MRNEAFENWWQEGRPVEACIKAQMSDCWNAALASQRRLWDLVRYQRSELHEAGLITDDEYAALAQDHAAVERLETYDKLKTELASQRELMACGHPKWALTMRHSVLIEAAGCKYFSGRTGNDAHWTEDPWKAIPFLDQADAEQQINWYKPPLQARPISHGFEICSWCESLRAEREKIYEEIAQSIDGNGQLCRELSEKLKANGEHSMSEMQKIRAEQCEGLAAALRERLEKE